MELKNKGSLITYTDKDGTERCLGDLMHFDGRGTYDPSHGKVDVTKEEADLHNAAWGEAYIKGMENCEMGQGGTFYLTGPKGDERVTTFSGAVVALRVRITGKSIWFTRGGKAYRGVKQKDAQCFNFRRVA